MFFKSDRGVRCAIKSSRSVFCDDVFFATIMFCHGVIVLVGQATKEWETRSVWCDGVFFATVCFLRWCVFCDGVFFAKVCVSATRCLLQIYGRVFCYGVQVLLASVAGCFLRHCVFCAGQWVFFASIKSVSCTVKVCFLRRRGFFATESRVYSNIGLDSLRDCGG